MRILQMKKLILTSILFLVSTNLYATIGKGQVTDVTLRTWDNLLVVRVTIPGAQPSCATWYHQYALKIDNNPVIGASIYSMLMSAMKNGDTVRINGTGQCLPGTGTEELKEVNVGPWQN
jgi:hypothetical protein